MMAGIAVGARAQEAIPPPLPAASAFRDVPPDHWAREAIRRLVDSGVMEGLPDGTFKGRKIVTRYDMAMIVARLLAKVTEIRSAGGKLTADDVLLVNRLTDEFRSELALLAVKVEAAERRVDKVEKQTTALEAALSNVRIEGFYRLENQFIFRPFNYTNYPFAVSQNPYTGFTDQGLQALSQEAFLRFIGSPFLAGQLFKNVETFVELRPKITGPTLGNARLNFKFSGPPIAGDNLDDFATDIVDEQRVQVDKAHFVSNAKLAKVRAFSNESMSDSKDPAILLTVDSFDPAPFSGVEVEGAIKKFSYWGSALKFISLSPSPFPNGNDELDLTDFYKPLEKTENDIFFYRHTYEPYKKKEGKGPTTLTFGNTFVEKVYSYDVRDNFSRVIAFDMTLAREWTDSKFDLVIEPQFSKGLDPDRLAPPGLASQDIRGEAFRLDTSYQHKVFLASFKGHTFSRFFRAPTGARQYVDHNIPPYRDNFRRKNNADDAFDPAETLGRLNLKWDLGQKVFTHIPQFTLSLLAEGKRFADNPLAPRFDDDRAATRYFIQVITDWNDKTHMDAIHEQQFHLPPNVNPPADVKAIEISRLTVDFKATSKTSVIGELEWIDDLNRDAFGPDGKHFSLERSKFQVNSQLSKTYFASVYTEQVENALQRRFVDPNGNVIRPLARNAQRVNRPQRNGLDLWTIGAETNLQLFDNKAALKTYGLRESAKDRFDPTLDGITNVFVAELSANWTRALKGRYQWGINDQQLVNRQDNFSVNNYAEIIYTPSEKTEIRMTYGYEYENADDRFDDGPYLFFRTHKLLELKAQTDF